MTYSGHDKFAGIGKALAIGSGAFGAHLATTAILHRLMDRREQRRDKKSGKTINVVHENRRADDIAGIITPFGVAGVLAYLNRNKGK